ncbi:hypothetical protein B0T13DRAFT_318653 [Neurospora crassa]|nr:hypothetical protein B0T13DRAFT_318653 [Neurospora crassa]
MTQFLQLLAPFRTTRNKCWICLDLLGSACCCLLVLAWPHELLPTGALTHHLETEKQKDPSGTRSLPIHWLPSGDNREEWRSGCVFVGTKKAGMPMIVEANSGAHQPQVFTDFVDFAFLLRNPLSGRFTRYPVRSESRRLPMSSISSSDAKWHTASTKSAAARRDWLPRVPYSAIPMAHRDVKSS